jgi:alkyl hydroperoxide reductase subunit AhpC
MTLLIGDVVPDFEADTTQGHIDFYKEIEGHWAILFSHPADFTPVCTTELGYTAKLQPDFQKRDVKVFALSVDPLEKHERWSGDIKDVTGFTVNFPMIADPGRQIANLYGMIHPNASDTSTVRSVFVIGPDKKVKMKLEYPASAGRNFDEILRVIDSLQLTAKHKVSTPVNWKAGEDVIIVPAVSDDEAKKKYPDGWRAEKPYLRYVPQPRE